MTTATAIRVQGLEKTFKDVHVLRGVVAFVRARFDIEIESGRTTLRTLIDDSIETGTDINGDRKSIAGIRRRVGRTVVHHGVEAVVGF